MPRHPCPSRRSSLPAWVRVLALVLAVAMGMAVPARCAEPRPKNTAKKPVEPIPEGEPTTAANVHLPAEREIRLGREISAQIEEHYKVIESGPDYERVQRIGKAIEQAVLTPEVAEAYRRAYKLPRGKDTSKRLPFEFAFKLVDDDKLVNAVSLAGGPIYVTTGLLNEAGSDDEIAAVMAHEAAHVAFHHVLQLIGQQRKASKDLLWAMLAALVVGIGGGGRGGASAGAFAAMSAQSVAQSVMSGYSQELEAEADRVGVMILTNTPYSPVAMVTFMKKMARRESYRGAVATTGYETHPYSAQRVKAIYGELERWRIPASDAVERQASGRFQVVSRPTTVGDQDAVDILLNERLLFRCVAADGELTPQERARRIVTDLRSAFHNALTFDDVRLTPDGEGVLIRGDTLVRPLPVDIEANGAPAAEQASQAYNVIMRALWQERLEASF